LRLPDHALTPQRLEVTQALLHSLRSVGECRCAPGRDLATALRRVPPSWSAPHPCGAPVPAGPGIPVPAPPPPPATDPRQGQRRSHGVPVSKRASGGPHWFAKSVIAASKSVRYSSDEAVQATFVARPLQASEPNWRPSCCTARSAERLASMDRYMPPDARVTCPDTMGAPAASCAELTRSTVNPWATNARPTPSLTHTTGP